MRYVVKGSVCLCFMLMQGFVGCWCVSSCREQTLASRGQGVRDAGQQRYRTKKQPFVSHFGFDDRDSLYSGYTQLRPVVVTSEGETNGLNFHAWKEPRGICSSGGGRLDGGGVAEICLIWSLCQIDWELTAESSPNRPACAKCVILGLRLVCRDLLTEKDKSDLWERGFFFFLSSSSGRHPTSGLWRGFKLS